MAAKVYKTPMYACIVFFAGSTLPKKWKYVRDLQSFTRFLNREHASWQHMNVYQKGTKLFLKRFYPSSSVPKTLSLLLPILLTLNSPSVQNLLSL
jgi:hypothetical protein